MDVMDLRRGIIESMASDDWTIVLKPMDADGMFYSFQTAVTVGQKITVSWKTDTAYTNRYIMRTLTARLDDGGQYAQYVPNTWGMAGTHTFTVTQAGNMLFAGYNPGYVKNTNFIGDYIKVKIENPEA